MTNSKSNVNVKIDTEVKELATQLLYRMGIDQTTAIDMFYRQIIAEMRLPFQPTVAHTFDGQTITAAAIKNITQVKPEADKSSRTLPNKKNYLDYMIWRYDAV